MKRGIIFLSLVVFVLFISSCEYYLKETNQSNKPVTYSPLNYNSTTRCYNSSNILYIKLKDSSKISNQKDIKKLVNDIVPKDKFVNPLSSKKLFKISGDKSKKLLQKKYGLDRWIKLEFPEGTDLSELLSNIKSLPYVEDANLAGTTCLIGTPNDPSAAWHIFEYPGINAIGAWDIETGSPDIKVAVPDTDVLWYHEDLVDNVWRNLGEDADGDGDVLVWNDTLNRYTFDPGDLNGVDDDNNGYIDDLIGWDFIANDNDPAPLPYITFSHGTATTGLISAKTNNSKGVSGLCWNCKFIALKGYGSGYPEGIQYAVDNGARLISMSWMSDYNGALKDVLDYAYESGVALFTGAGNFYRCDPGRTNNLCDSERVFCVAGSTSTARAWYGNSIDNYCTEGQGGSNSGPKVDLASPAATYTTNSYLLSSDYVWASGTSFSSPITAGVAALMLSKNPNLSVNEVYSILQYATSPFNKSNPINRYVGTGIINASKALYITNKTTITGSFPIAIIDSMKTKFEGDLLKIYGTAGGDNFHKAEIYYGEGVDPSTFNLVGEITNKVTNGLIYSFNTSILTPNTDYVIKIKVFDSFGQIAVDTFPININPQYKLGWPQRLEGRSHGNILTEDLDKDGKKEIVIQSDKKIYIFNSNGSYFPGWPINVSKEATPIVADFDFDGVEEIITATSANNMSIFYLNGSYFPGWPKSYRATSISDPIASDLNNDGSLELIFYVNDKSNRAYLYVLNSSGSNISNFPKYFSDSIYDISVGDLNNDSIKEIVLSGQNLVYICNLTGDIISTQMYAPKTVIGDVNLDGINELIATNGKDLKLIFYNGSEIASNTTSQYYYDRRLALATDPETQSKIIFVLIHDTTGYFIGAYDSDLISLKPWNRAYYNVSLAPITVADIGGDNNLDIMGGYYYHGFSTYSFTGDYVKLISLDGLTGNLKSGWPKKISWEAYDIGATISRNPPIIDDIDQDNKTDLIFATITAMYTTDNRLHVWELNTPYSGKRDWPYIKHDLFNTGDYSFNQTEYTPIPYEQTINLTKGWNIITIRIKNDSLTTDLFNDSIVLSYNGTGWNAIKTEENNSLSLDYLKTYFVYSKLNQTINLTGRRIIHFRRKLADSRWNIFSVQENKLFKDLYPNYQLNQGIYKPVIESGQITFQQIDPSNTPLTPDIPYWGLLN